MSTLKRTLHGASIAVSQALTKLLPDRVPVTFVGPGSAAELCEAIAKMGVGRVLLVSDEMLVELGLVARITAALDAAGLPYTIYAGVEPDPTTEQVEAGLARLRSEGCDAVLALGGGSPMDAAKVIAAAASNGGAVEKLEGMFKVRRPPLPIFAIPTTAGTGSEATVVAVVSDPQSHTKRFVIDPKLLPQMAALDPTLMTGLPPAVTAATGMDALTHAVESFLSQASNPQTETWSRTAVRLIFENLPVAYTRGDDVAARKAMALASYYAGLAFTRTSVGYVHAIAHTFGALYRTPHGLANAIALPRVLEFSMPAAAPRMALLAELLELDGADENARARAFIAAVRDLMGKIGIPQTLDALREEDIPRIAERAVAEAHLKYPVPRYMSQAECEDVVRQMLA